MARFKLVAAAALGLGLFAGAPPAEAQYGGYYPPGVTPKIARKQEQLHQRFYNKYGYVYGTRPNYGYRAGPPYGNAYGYHRNRGYGYGPPRPYRESYGLRRDYW
jgi:hypothetical protein